MIFQRSYFLLFIVFDYAQAIYRTRSPMLMSYAKRSVLDDMWSDGDDFKRSMYDGAEYGPASYKRDSTSPVSRFMKLAYQ